MQELIAVCLRWTRSLKPPDQLRFDQACPSVIALYAWNVQIPICDHCRTAIFNDRVSVPLPSIVPVNLAAHDMNVNWAAGVILLHSLPIPIAHRACILLPLVSHQNAQMLRETML